jgi:hypothetical protein
MSGEVTRLLRPLDDAQAALGWLPDNRYQRRGADDSPLTLLSVGTERR